MLRISRDLKGVSEVEHEAKLGFRPISEVDVERNLIWNKVTDLFIIFEYIDLNCLLKIEIEGIYFWFLFARAILT